VLVRVEAFFYRCVAAGQQRGEIACAQPAEDLARALLGALLGIRVLARARPERALLEGLLRPTLALLDPRDADRTPDRARRRRTGSIRAAG